MYKIWLLDLLNMLEPGISGHPGWAMDSLITLMLFIKISMLDMLEMLESRVLVYDASLQSEFFVLCKILLLDLIDMLESRI